MKNAQDETYTQRSCNLLMNLITNFGTCVRKSFVWRGRATRAELWYFVGASTMLTTALTMIAEATGSNAIALLEMGVMLTLIPASLAATVRRLHDRGRSAAWAVAGIGMWLPVTGGLVSALGVHLAEPATAGWTPATQKWMEAPKILIAYVGVVTAAIGVWITLLVMLVRKGDAGENAYGPPG